jgi:trehalose/maltose hydrolase-like predicted phosphorylase
VSQPPSEPENWFLHFDVTARNRRAIESMTVLSDGDIATRCLTPRPEPTFPTTLAAGAYDEADVPGLLVGPEWTAMNIATPESAIERVQLDMFRGVLSTEVGRDAMVVRSTRFASIVRPGIHVVKVDGPMDLVGIGPSTVTPVNGFVAATTDLVTDDGTNREIVRIAAIAALHVSGVAAENLDERLSEAVDLGFDHLLDEHATAWSCRWQQCAVDMPSQPALERAVRLAQFHLLSAMPQSADAGIGARGLTGPAYKGHVFWDTDVFIVPALAAFAPEGALDALRYRWRRLDAARRRASDDGRQGARFPWESAVTGDEVTPTIGRDLHGGSVPILTGQLEEHIVADVAWAACAYLAWTDDTDTARTIAADLLVETARYWQSRIELDSDGSGHIRSVIGPDEYHEGVDDNAYTNLMARWNLVTAANLADRFDLPIGEEVAQWRSTSDEIVDGFDDARGLYEQFDGYFELDEMMAATLGAPPLAADALLGRDRIQRSQIIKQADVVMLHHVVPELMRLGSLERDLDFYLPRTAHGSSLSPGITASVLARAGRATEAQQWFSLAARFDLDDVSGTTAGGVHLATMGGLWQALVAGFLGLHPTAVGLRVDPVIPDDWGTVTSRMYFRGNAIEVEASMHEFCVSSPNPVTVIDRTGNYRTGCRITARSTGNDWSFT